MIAFLAGFLLSPLLALGQVPSMSFSQMSELYKSARMPLLADIQTPQFWAGKCMMKKSSKLQPGALSMFRNTVKGKEETFIRGVEADAFGAMSPLKENYYFDLTKEQISTIIERGKLQQPVFDRRNKSREYGVWQPAVEIPKVDYVSSKKGHFIAGRWYWTAELLRINQDEMGNRFWVLQHYCAPNVNSCLYEGKLYQPGELAQYCVFSKDRLK